MKSFGDLEDQGWSASGSRPLVLAVLSSAWHWQGCVTPVARGWVLLLESASSHRAKSCFPTPSVPALVLISVSGMVWSQSVLSSFLLKHPEGLQNIGQQWGVPLLGGTWCSRGKNVIDPSAPCHPECAWPHREGSASGTLGMWGLWLHPDSIPRPARGSSFHGSRVLSVTVGVLPKMEIVPLVFRWGNWVKEEDCRAQGQTW